MSARVRAFARALDLSGWLCHELDLLFEAMVAQPVALPLDHTIYSRAPLSAWRGFPSLDALKPLDPPEYHA